MDRPEPPQPVSRPGIVPNSNMYPPPVLGEELIEYRAGGYTLERLAVDLRVELPVAVLDYLRGY